MAASIDKEFDFIKTRQHQNIPGYGGHCPNVSCLYGTTYGNATKRTFIEREDDKTTTSKISSLCRRTLSVPSDVKLYLKSNPSRPTSAHSTEVQLPYTLSHTGKRRDEVLNFNEVSQRHRNYYQDLTGTVHHVPLFTHRRVVSAPSIRYQGMPIESHGNAAPNPKMVSFVKYSKISFSELRHPKYTHRQPTAREKKTRDVYFERR